MKTHKQLPRELAPCGVYCGACPSFDKTCLGCPSEDHNQSRSGKWGCKIRICCYDNQKLAYCINCDGFPCSLIQKKLINSHPGNAQFTYRHKIPEDFKKLKTLGVKGFLEYQKQKWKCDSCNGTIRFYHYTCSNCGYKKMIN